MQCFVIFFVPLCSYLWNILPPSVVFSLCAKLCHQVVLIVGKWTAWGDSGSHRWQHRHKRFCSLWARELFVPIWGTGRSIGRYGRQFCLRVRYASGTTCTEGEPPQVDGQFAASHLPPLLIHVLLEKLPLVFLSVFCTMHCNTGLFISPWNTLENWLMPQLNEDSNDYFFQPDGSPVHYKDVWGYLSRNLPQRCIGRTGKEDDALTRWPPRSPDLTPCDFFFWGLWRTLSLCLHSPLISRISQQYHRCCGSRWPWYADTCGRRWTIA